MRKMKGFFVLCGHANEIVGSNMFTNRAMAMTSEAFTSSILSLLSHVPDETHPFNKHRSCTCPDVGKCLGTIVSAEFSELRKV